MVEIKDTGIYFTINNGEREYYFINLENGIKEIYVMSDDIYKLERNKYKYIIRNLEGRALDNISYIIDGVKIVGKWEQSEYGEEHKGILIITKKSYGGDDVTDSDKLYHVITEVIE